MPRWSVKSFLYHYYRRIFPFNRILGIENKRLKELLQLVPKEHEVILDIGTGHGNALRILDVSPVNRKLSVGIDLSRQMLKCARNSVSSEFIQGDVFHLPLPDRSVTLVLAVGLLEYLPEFTSFFTEICRVVKKDGNVILTISPRNIFFYFRRLFGHRLYSIAAGQFEALADSYSLELVKKSRTFMQIQYLYQKTS